LYNVIIIGIKEINTEKENEDKINVIEDLDSKPIVNNKKKKMRKASFKLNK